MSEWDVIVVGAGVAGSTSTWLLGRAGFRVLLLDRARFPRSKICGEGLMPVGADILRRLGLSDGMVESGARDFFGIRFRLPDGVDLSLDFREFNSRSGWVVRREQLDLMLLQCACRQESVTFRAGIGVRSCQVFGDGVRITTTSGETFQARLVLGADGIRSIFHQGLKLRRHIPLPQRFALRAFFDEYPDEDLVEVFCRPGAEAYVAAHGRGARISLLLDKGTRLRRNEDVRSFYCRQLRRFPLLQARLGSQRPQKVEATFPVALQVDRSHGERVLLVGDAAGAVDPLTGQGMTLALRDADLAARIIGEQLPAGKLSASDLSLFSEIRRQYFLPRFRQAQELIWVLHRPSVARRAARAIRRSRALRHRLVRMASEANGAAHLRWNDRLRLAVGW